MTRPAVKLPDSKGGWASLLLGIGLLFMSAAHAVGGDYEQASLDLAGAFGTLGLPAIFGRGYHPALSISNRVADLSPPKGFEGVGRLTESNEDIDCDPIEPKPKPRPKSGPVIDVRRADEL